MPKKLTYTAEEVKTIFAMKEKGYSYKEIAEKVHRTTKAIAMFCQVYRPLGLEKTLEKAKKEKHISENLPDLEEVLAQFPDNPPGFIQEEIKEPVRPVKAAPVATAEKPVEPVKQKTITDFTSREMLYELFGKRGYFLEDGKLYCYIKQEVKLQDIIKNGQNYSTSR